MPLNEKGKSIMASMRKHYGAKKAKQVFYASRNKGTITGVDPESRKRAILRYRNRMSK
jgi:hypothetical protein